MGSMNLFKQDSVKWALGLVLSSSLVACGGGNTSSSTSSQDSSSSSSMSSTMSSSSLSSSSSSSSSSVNNDESFVPVSNPNGYMIEEIVNCGVNSATSNNARAVFSNNTNSISGWSHVGTLVNVSDLQQNSAQAYAVPGATSANSNCNNQNTQDLILVKKYANWDQQHANGIEPSISSSNKTFADIDSIVIELKLNSAKTSIPSASQLQSKFGSVLTSTQLAQLDKSKAAFAVSVLDPNNNNPDLQAERYIELDPATMADKWLRITIPFDQMELFTTANYYRTSTNLSQHASVVADRLQISPETYGNTENINEVGWVVRNFLDDARWSNLSNQNNYEAYKELSITLKKFEIIWK